jgi:hypothetical protein
MSDDHDDGDDHQTIKAKITAHATLTSIPGGQSRLFFYHTHSQPTYRIPMEAWPLVTPAFGFGDDHGFTCSSHQRRSTKPLLIALGPSCCLSAHFQVELYRNFLRHSSGRSHIYVSISMNNPWHLPARLLHVARHPVTAILTELATGVQKHIRHEPWLA